MSGKSRFLLDDALASPGDYVLNRQESHHAVNVLRHREGDAVIVFDGRGNYAEAVVTNPDRDAMRVRVDGVFEEKHLPLALTIATALPKGKRWQALVEKCTELGVDRIIPLLSERSVAKGEGDIGKWRRWLVEAAKQSRRSRLPEITEPTPLDAILAAAKRDNAMLLLADPQGENPSGYRETLRNILQVIVMIGPEGGFSGREADALRKAGAHPICLSPFTLRIETAAAVVCGMIREIVM